MKRKVLSIILVLVLVLTSVSLVACNKDATISKDTWNLPVGSKPSYSTLISAENQTIIDQAVEYSKLDSRTVEQEAVIKSAVFAMYNIANGSRINTPLSLMVQKTDMIPSSFPVGVVGMRGFTLKVGDKWYYQFAAQGQTDDEFITALLSAFSQQLQIAYTEGDGNYYYQKVAGEEPECDCNVSQFPYATFKVTQDFNKYDEEGFQNVRYYLKSQMEINNMDLSKEIIADGAKITYDSVAGLYNVQFAVDTKNSDKDLLSKWWAQANKDMSDADFSITGYEYWYATMELWNNGYVKSFISDENREAGMGGGKTTNAFEYLWVEDEIVSLLKQDARFAEVAVDTFAVDEFIDAYVEVAHNKVPARLGKLAKIGIIVGSVLGAIIISIIITVIVVETGLKKGKYPKLAAKRQAKKEKKLAKKEARKNRGKRDE